MIFVFTFLVRLSNPALYVLLALILALHYRVLMCSVSLIHQHDCATEEERLNHMKTAQNYLLEVLG